MLGVGDMWPAPLDIPGRNMPSPSRKLGTGSLRSAHPDIPRSLRLLGFLCHELELTSAGERTHGHASWRGIGGKRGLANLQDVCNVAAMDFPR
jgi:hypothetical protein